MNNQSGVYVIIHRDSGKFYIGSALRINKRFSAHRCNLKKGKHHNAHLQAAWNKYGEDAFDFEILIKCQPDERSAHEQEAIRILKPAYNIAQDVVAPMKGLKHSPEECARISAMFKGKPKSEEHKKRLSKARTGSHHTEETKEKLSVISKARKHTLARRKAQSIRQRGRPVIEWNETQRANQSERMKSNTYRRGSKASDQTKQNMSESQKRRFATKGGLSVEAKRKISKANKVHAANRAALITHCPKGHEYTEANTYRSAHHSRSCRTCARESMREKRARKAGNLSP